MSKNAQDAQAANKSLKIEGLVSPRTRNGAVDSGDAPPAGVGDSPMPPAPSSTPCVFTEEQFQAFAESTHFMDGVKKALDESFAATLNKHLPAALNKTLPAIVTGMLNDNNEKLTASFESKLEGVNSKLDKLVSDRPDFGPGGPATPADDTRFDALSAEFKELQASTKALQSTVESASRPATSGYTTPTPSGAWGSGPPGSTPHGSPSFSPPAFGSPNPYAQAAWAPSTGFDRAPDPTVIKVTCHKSTVLRTDVKDFVLKQLSEAGLDQCSITVKGIASANSFDVKFDGELQRCCSQVKQLLDSQKVDKGIWKQHTMRGTDDQPYPVYINPDKNGRQVKSEVAMSKVVRKFKELHPSLKDKIAQFKDSGLIQLHWKPLVRVVVESQHVVALDWNEASVEEYHINQAAIVAHFKEDIGAGANVVWKRS